ncbi:hypothetical protein FYJ57_11745 [Lachnospiraceae bacterium BSM-380-WT-5A]|uniref:Uncharacterized protein n=1 Tax=Oliverpabstia intestinalis TaxID=2606633 RepID=A0A7X2TLH5_9FIRM|nr:hypothetical protein [Oliverpabstia intestinalis]
MLLCHNEILLQHVSIVPCLYIFGTSHFDLYYLYSSTNLYIAHQGMAGSQLKKSLPVQRYFPP